MDDLVEWTTTDPCEVYDLTLPAGLAALRDRYGGQHFQILCEVVGQALDAGAVSALAEYRYLDADYRSEHTAFYSTTFRRYPSIAHRLHFFSQPLDDAALDTSHPTAFAEKGYLGYTVIRPVSANTVGRTVITPPPELADHVTCRADDEVNLFGSRLVANGAPFLSQDSQLGVCVHATAWVCAYYHHIAFDAPRVLPAEIASAVPLEIGRLRPAANVSIEQLTAVLSEIGIPPVVYDLTDLPDKDDDPPEENGELPGEEDDLDAIACRYLNSGLPVIGAGGGHAFVLVGYRHVIDVEGKRRIQFIRQDDQDGPYRLVDYSVHDDYRPWDYLVIPLPPKVYVSAERAEVLGHSRIREALEQAHTAECDEMIQRLANGEVVMRTRAMRSNEFKVAIAERNFPDEVVAAYQWMHMSRWIWIIEAVDGAAWDAGQDCVLAEAIIDATDHTDRPRALAWRIPGHLGHWLPDTADFDHQELPPIPPQPTLVEGNPQLIAL